MSQDVVPSIQLREADDCEIVRLHNRRIEMDSVESILA
jgi:hypothetical protein